MENKDTLRLISIGTSCVEKTKILQNAWRCPVEYLQGLGFQEQADSLGNP